MNASYSAAAAAAQFSGMHGGMGGHAGMSGAGMGGHGGGMTGMSAACMSAGLSHVPSNQRLPMGPADYGLNLVCTIY